MRVIEKRWKYLEEGYKKLQSLDAQLDTRWKRPVQAAQRRKFRQEYATWKSSRRTLLLFIAGFTLGCSLLCSFAYFADNWNLQCLYSFLAFTLLLVGMAFALFKRRYIRYAFNRPVLETYQPPSRRLMDLWWKNLAPRFKPSQDSGDEGVEVFLDLLEHKLPDSYIAIPEILTSIKRITDTDVLLFGPSGIWAFEMKHWYGAVHKKDGVWWQTVSNRRIDHLQDSGEQKQGPDEQWMNQAREIKTTLKRRRPDIAWIADNVHGGIVFSHPEVLLDKSNIQANLVPYGKPRPWLDRILTTQAVKNFALHDQLRVLDALIEYGLSIERDEINPVSALKLADWAYQKISQELTEYVEKWTK